MRRLIALYPRPWRDRYAAEFDDLLAERPASLLDHLDVVLGAIDAWIHPQVRGQAADRAASGPGRPRPWASAAAILGGALLILSGVGMRATEKDRYLGYKEVEGAILVLVLGMVLVSVAAVVRSSGRSRLTDPARAAAVAMLLGAVGTALPWPFLVVGLLGFAFASILYGAVIALRDRQPLGILIGLGSLALAAVNTEDDRALLTIPLALVWILVGVADLRPAHRPGPAPVIERSGT